MKEVTIALAGIVIGLLALTVAGASFTPEYMSQCNIDAPFTCSADFSEGMSVSVTGQGVADVRATIMGPCGAQSEFTTTDELIVDYACENPPAIRSEITVLYTVDGERRVANGELIVQ